MGMLNDFLDVQHRPAGDPRRIHHIFQFLLRIILCPVADQPLEGVQVVLHPQVIGLETRIFQQLLLADGLAEFFPKPLISYAKRHIAVLAGEDVKGGNRRIHIAVPLRNHAVHGIIRDGCLQQAENSVKHRHIHMLPLAGHIPVVQGNQRPHGLIDAGYMVGHGWPHLHWRTFLEACHIEHAAHGLRHHVITWPVADGAPLAEARARYINNARVNLADGLIINFQLLGHAALVILTEEICVFHQFIEHLKALFRFQV